MEGKNKRWHILFIVLNVALLAYPAYVMGVRGEAMWFLPAILLFFLLVYLFDVRLPALGRMNADHVVAAPALVLMQNPFLVGLAAGVGVLLSRLYRKGPRGITAVNYFDASQVVVALTYAGWAFLALTRHLAPASLAWIPYVLLFMVLFNAISLAFFVTDRKMTGEVVTWSFLRTTILQTGLWFGLSLPFAALVVFEILAGSLWPIILGSISLLLIVWALRLNSVLEEKNEALMASGRRQEFLQQLTMTSMSLLGTEGFLQRLLRGLREFVSWDRALLLMLPTSEMEAPLLVSLEPLPGDVARIQEVLKGYLESASLRRPRLASEEAISPLLDASSRNQIVLALATSEVAYGVLVAERRSPKAFLEEEVQFLDLAFNQIASHVQDEILKRQLLASNHRLLRQAGYLSEILQISNLLKVHLDVQGILEKVAQGIRESIGFGSVLISLYHEDEGYFERLAQAGEEERWEEIRVMRPPAEDILCYLQNRYRVGGCYMIRHTDVQLRPFDVLPKDMKPARDQDDWDPMDMLLVPLEDKDGHLLGIISVDEPGDGKIPSPETFRALEVLANQTVHALESAEVHAQIKRQAVLDGLTGLHNHGYFQETMAMRARESAEAKQPYALLMLDLDNFKDINDSFGHLAGDSVLKAVAEALAGSIRREDVAARYGGEEFAIFLPRRNAEQARLVGERIRTAVEDLRIPVPGVPPVQVTVSIGVASWPEHGGDHHQVLEQADLALYRAKRQGKNMVCQIAVGG